VCTDYAHSHPRLAGAFTEGLTVRALIAAPILIGFTIADTALTLLANFWKPLADELNPRGFWVSVAFAKFMDGGGRLALGLVLAALVVALGWRFGEMRHRNRTSAALSVGATREIERSEAI
jgi:hypothetical protein